MPCGSVHMSTCKNEWEVGWYEWKTVRVDFMSHSVFDPIINDINYINHMLILLENFLSYIADNDVCMHLKR